MPKRPIRGAFLWGGLGLFVGLLLFFGYHQLWPHEQFEDDHNLISQQER